MLNKINRNGLAQANSGNKDQKCGMTHRGQSSPAISSWASSPSRQKRGRLQPRTITIMGGAHPSVMGVCSFMGLLLFPKAVHSSSSALPPRTACAKHPMVAGRTSSPMDEALLCFEPVWFGANFLSILDSSLPVVFSRCWRLHPALLQTEPPERQQRLIH